MYQRRYRKQGCSPITDCIPVSHVNPFPNLCRQPSYLSRLADKHNGKREPVVFDAQVHGGVVTLGDLLNAPQAVAVGPAGILLGAFRQGTIFQFRLGFGIVADIVDDQVALLRDSQVDQPLLWVRDLADGLNSVIQTVA